MARSAPPEAPIKVIAADFVTTAVEPAGWPKGEVPEVAFVGRSNVGKSSLINALTSRKKLARVSNTPGRTRHLNFFSVTVEPREGERRTVRFCDLPGYGFAKVSKAERKGWQDMIEGYLRDRRSLAAVVCIVDANVGPTEDDLQVIPWVETIGRQPIVAATKLDKLPKAKQIPRIRDIAEALEVPRERVLGVSSVSGLRLDDLWAQVLAASFAPSDE